MYSSYSCFKFINWSLFLFLSQIMDIKIPNVPLPEPDRPVSSNQRRAVPPAINTREDDARAHFPTSARATSANMLSPVTYRNEHDEKPVGGSPRSAAALSAHKSVPEVAGDGEYPDDFSGSGAQIDSPVSGRKTSHTGGSRHLQNDPVQVADVERPVDEAEDATDGTNTNTKQIPSNKTSFPPGEHPLEGVPNLKFDELPSPEPLSTVSKQVSGQSGIQGYLGEYVTECLFSRSWVLRDAAIIKAQLILTSEVEGNDEGKDALTALVSCLTPVIGVCKVGLDDKNLQVNFSAHGLVEYTLGLLERYELLECICIHFPSIFISFHFSLKVGRSTVAPVVDSLVVLLIDKLSDSNQRVRDSSKRSLATMSGSSSVGPSLLSACALRALSAKQKTAWRPLQSRLVLLSELISQHGVGGQSGLHSDAIMAFMRSSNAFAHSNGEVRDAAKDLTVQLQKLVGTAPLESYLEELRPKQKEEYFLSFEAGKKYVLGVDATGKKTQIRSDMPNSVEPKPSSRGSANSYEYKADEYLPVNTTRNDQVSSRPTSSSAAMHTCQFCGAGDTRWTEDLLDEHYLSSCPYLAPCPECTQILEIASLPDHLLDECKSKSKYVPCDVTGLAIKKADLAKWLASPSCVAPPDNCFYCPLCMAAVADDNEPWRVHLLYDCVENTRAR